MNSSTITSVLSSANSQHKSLCIHHKPENSQNMDIQSLDSEQQTHEQETSEQELSVNSAMQGNTSHSDDQRENNKCVKDFIPIENNGQLPDQCNYEALESESTVETTHDDNSDHENQISSTHRFSPLGCDNSEIDTPSVLNVENELKELSIENNGGPMSKHKACTTHISGELPFENNGGAIHKHTTCVRATHQFIAPKYHVNETNCSRRIVTRPVPFKVTAYRRVPGFSTLVPSTQCAVSTSRSISLEMDGPETTEPTYGLELEIPPTIVQEPSMSDIILLFTEEDEVIAHEFRDHLLTVIEVDNLTVDCMNDVNLGQSEISSLHRLHDSHINILALITPNLKRDDYQCFVNEVLLVLGLRNADKKHRFIPVWMSEEKPIIPELIVFEKSGIDYFRFKSYTLEFLRKSYKKKIVKKILEGRQKFL